MRKEQIKTVTEKLLEDPDYFLRETKEENSKDSKSTASRSATAFIDKLENNESEKNKLETLSGENR